MHKTISGWMAALALSLTSASAQPLTHETDHLGPDPDVLAEENSASETNPPPEEEEDFASPERLKQYLEKAETRLKLLRDDLGDNDRWKRRHERLEERLGRLKEGNRTERYVDMVRGFAVELRKLEAEVYGGERMRSAPP